MGNLHLTKSLLTPELFVFYMYLKRRGWLTNRKFLLFIQSSGCAQFFYLVDSTPHPLSTNQKKNTRDGLKLRFHPGSVLILHLLKTEGGKKGVTEEEGRLRDWRKPEGPYQSLGNDKRAKRLMGVTPWVVVTFCL